MTEAQQAQVAAVRRALRWEIAAWRESGTPDGAILAALSQEADAMRGDDGEAEGRLIERMRE